MRKSLGLLVLLVGLLGLGLWGYVDQAGRMEAKVRAAAEGVVTGAIHPMAVEVSGRDITLSGTADSADELIDVLAALDRVTGRRVVRQGDVTVLPHLTPFETAIAKGPDGSIALTGHAPSAVQAGVAEARGVPGAAQLPLASGAADGWSETMIRGLEALGPLEEGSFALSGSSAILSGKALTPVEARAARNALALLPKGVDGIAAIDVVDPGIISFELHYGAGEGLSVFGTTPESFPPAQMAAVLGVDRVAGETASTFGADPSLAPQLAALAPLLAELDALTLRDEDGAISVTATAAPGIDTTQVALGLSEALPRADILVRIGTAPEDGATRLNRATGRNEFAQAGFWLPRYDFPIDRAGCTAKAEAIQADRRIQFVSGSAELDVVSMAVINDLAGLLVHCTSKVGMTVIIGGHTDNQGDENENYSLSVARAGAVRDALVERGVTQGMMQAIGFGATEPIANNDTEEGRSANRRTSFDWPQ